MKILRRTMGLKCHKNLWNLKEFCQIVLKPLKNACFAFKNTIFFADTTSYSPAVSCECPWPGRVHSPPFPPWPASTGNRFNYISLLALCWSKVIILFHRIDFNRLFVVIFSPTRPSGPSWTSSRNVCLFLCLFVLFSCIFFLGLFCAHFPKSDVQSF